MRTLAITGMVTVAMISRITFIEAMRATPPSLRMSEGTRSSAITAQAPAFSAILACSAVVTSMMTPPFSISARPTFTRHSLGPAFPLPLPFTFFESINCSFSFAMLMTCGRPENGRASKLFSDYFRAQHYETCCAFCQDITGGVTNFAGLKNVAPFEAGLECFHGNFLVNAYGLQILDGHFRGNGARVAEPANFSHRFIEQRGDDSAVAHAASALIARTENKASDDAAADIVLRKGQLHAAVIRATAAETFIFGIGRESDCVGQIIPSLSFQKPLQSSNQGDAAALRAAHTPLELAHFDAKHIRKRSNTAGDLFFIEAGKTEAQRIGQRVLHVEIAARGEKHAALFHVNQQFAGIEARRQLEPQAHAAFWARPASFFRHVLAQSLVKSFEARGINFSHFGEMLGEKAAAQKFRKSGLRELIGVQVSGLFHQAQALDGGGGSDDPADAEPGEGD